MHDSEWQMIYVSHVCLVRRNGQGELGGRLLARGCVHDLRPVASLPRDKPVRSATGRIRPAGELADHTCILRTRYLRHIPERNDRAGIGD
jgi:hypothetical protein